MALVALFTLGLAALGGVWQRGSAVATGILLVVIVAATAMLGVASAFVIAAAADADRVAGSLGAAASPLAEPALDVARVEAGWPRWGVDVDETRSERGQARVVGCFGRDRGAVGRKV